jgi:hypothetical protein
MNAGSRLFEVHDFCDDAFCPTVAVRASPSDRFLAFDAARPVSGDAALPSRDLIQEVTQADTRPMDTVDGRVRSEAAGFMKRSIVGPLLLSLAMGACSGDETAANPGAGGSAGTIAGAGGTRASGGSPGSGAPNGGNATGGGSGSGGARPDGGPGSGGTGDASPGTGGAPGQIAGLTLHVEESTPEQIGVHAIVSGTIATGSKVNVRYKRRSDTAWLVGHPLLRINPAWVTGGAPEQPVDSFAGSIFDLTPGTEYDVELTLSEPGKPDRTLVTAASTRALPSAAPAANVTASPSDDLQAKLLALKAGDVLELADGIYDVDDLYLEASGTAAMPIYVRGHSRAGVVLRDATSHVFQFREAAYVVLENLTLEGSGVDSGTDSSSVGIHFYDGASQKYVTVRDIDIRAVDQGIIGYGSLVGVLIYHSSLHGNNTWTQPVIESNQTWNDDGITIPGLGNCAFENTLHGFGDSFAVRDGTHSAAVHFYRNRVTMTGDDTFEADYSTRNISFYDNWVDNASTFLSLDPLWGGPLFCFRNIVVNTVRGPFKLNNTNSGFMIYNNTIVRTEGTTGWGWVQFNNGELRNYSFRNNVLVYRGSGNLLAIESAGNEPLDFTNNAWFPDKSVWWTNTGGSFDSLASARTGVPETDPLFGTSRKRHEGDVITVSDPFTTPVTLGADHLTEVATATAPALAVGSSPKNAGVAIPNVTDGYSGGAPDMGAVIEGRPQPTRGAPRP